MPSDKNPDLHGFVPDKSPVALLLIDVINDVEFEGGEQLLAHAVPMARQLARLKGRMAAAGVPAVYVNDNFGKWQSDFKRLVGHCLRDPVRGREVAKLLQPGSEDYFVLKPKHSGFYETSLDILLRYLKVTTLILTGIAADNCVLFTASDAYVRDFHIVIPEDCVASIEPLEKENALRLMRRVLKAETIASDRLDLGHLTGLDRVPDCPVPPKGPVNRKS